MTDTTAPDVEVVVEPPPTPTICHGLSVTPIVTEVTQHGATANLPGIVFEFHDPDGASVGRFALVLPSTEMRSVRHLIGGALDEALTRARRWRR